MFRKTLGVASSQSEMRKSVPSVRLPTLSVPVPLCVSLCVSVSVYVCVCLCVGGSIPTMWGLKGLLTICLCLSWAVPPSGTFNLEAEGAQSFHGRQDSHFGEKVAQFKGRTETWTVVSAPLEVNETGIRTGRLYKCSYSRGQCQPLTVNAPPEAGAISLGLSLSPLNVGEGAFLACGPTLAHACGTNLYLNGVCYLFNGHLQHIARYPPRTQDCFTARVDLALLIDGSGSILPSDFTLIKEFILRMFQRYRHRDVQFAIMQFSDLVKKEFNFEEYELSNRNETLVQRIRQLTGDTYTPTAIKTLVEEIFVEESGLRSDSKRVMVVITDGKSNDPDTSFSEAIGLAQQKDILRFAIGVGPDFQSAEGRQELERIASNNTNSTVFSIQNFDALKTIQEQLQSKIFAIEGSQEAENLTVFQNEMAQEGFSSILTSDLVLMGSPGADGWTGRMAFYHRDTQRVTPLHLREQHAIYTGYSVQRATRAGNVYLITGAPRDRHTGKVVIFKQGDNGTWEGAQHILGQQIGSYFGSELGVMDVDGDGDTDFLLIGAPLHQEQHFGGKVQVCTMSGEGNFSCGVWLRGAEGDGLGRFGSSMAVLRDLNGDGMGDVAVGAPLEDEHRGRVYIFHGEREGIQPQYSQDLRGMRQSQSLRYFGCSLSGEMDVSGDQLTDLAIGSLGTVTVFRSRPVVTVSPRAVFQPQPIPMSRYRCDRAEQTDSPITNLTICFYMGRRRAGNLGELSANLTYRLVLDFERQHSRLTFLSVSRELTSSRQLSTGIPMCDHHTIHLTACVKDYLQPVRILLNFTIAGEEIPNTKGLRPIMDLYSQTSHTYKLPFELNCGADGQCVDFLRVSFHFTKRDVLLVGWDTVLRVSVQLENTHQVSDRPQLHFQPPECLTFRKISSVQPSSAVVGCSDVENSRLSCDIDHPTFPKDSRVTFNAEFDISDPGTEERTVNFTIIATSGNTVRITNESSLTRTLFLRYTISVVTSGIESTRHINVTIGSQELRLVQHSYQVENLGDRSVPIGVMLSVPDRLSGQSLWNVSVSPRNQTHGSVCSPPIDRPERPKGIPTHNRQENVTQDCGIAPCIVLRCDVSNLRGHEKLIFDIRGELRTEAITQLNVKQFKLVSKLRLRYDEEKYVDVSNVNNNLKESMMETEVDVLVMADNLLEIVAGSVAGLFLLVICCVVLYKMGFFKRNKASGDKDQLQEDSPPPVTEDSPAEAVTTLS